MDDLSSIEINNLLTEWKLQHLSDKFKGKNLYFYSGNSQVPH